MIQITTAQWYAWINAFAFPFLRILGLIVAEPILGNRAVPISAKVGLAIFVTMLLTPTLPAMPGVQPASAVGVVIAVQQLLIGLAMGFAIRIVLTAAEMAGHLSGLQMGLGFAVFFDPQTSAQTAVVGQFFGLFAILVFLSLNGHFLVLSALAESFRALPVAQELVRSLGWRNLVAFAGVIFSVGLLIALPIVATLLIANIAVGIMSRAAPQLNIFAVGFPITLAAGLLALYLAAPSTGAALTRLFEQGLIAIPRLLESFAGR
ncbi:MAG TPA: flagellar biosynthetic protein FliR [Burkholderiales bacterium]|nr:flagellar biosynthetic protein FliR [Burkholderiales bacterium]